MRGPVVAYGVSLAAVGVAVAVRLLLEPLLADRVPYMTLFAAVVFVAWYSGRGPALLALVVGALAVAYFILRPRYSLAIDQFEDQVGFVLYALVGCAIIAMFHSLDKSRRRLAEQAELQRVTIASVGDAIITTDARGNVTCLNGVATDLTGWTQDEAHGKPLTIVFNIINEQTRLPVENPATRALREGVIVGLANHTVLIAKDGAEQAIDDSAAPIRDAAGKIVGCVLVFRDITEQRRAEQALRESEARKSAVVASSLDGIITIDHQGQIVEFNPAAERMFGYRREEVLGREMAELIIPPPLRERHRQGIARYLATGEGPVLGQRLELTALRLDGAEFPVEVAITRINAVGPPLFTGYIRDLTERKQAEEAQSRLAAIVESSQDAIISKTLDGTILSWNMGAERLFGYTAHEAIGHNINLITPPERQDEQQEILARLARGERVEHFETVRVSKQGHRINISLTISPIRDATGRVVGASKVARDITQQKRIEEELHRIAAELSEADRRKNEFLAMLAHELRNPLAPIRNAVQMLRLTEGNSEAVASASAMMERQVGQMMRLVDDLLDTSRVSRGKIELRRERVELASIVHHAIEAVRPQCESKGHELIVTLPPQPIFLNADPTRLAQVLGNLLNNACKFTDRGGRIGLTIELASTEQTSGGRESHEEVVIRVRDSGIGIAAEQLLRIFEMFVQVDTSLERSVSGLGIGLTLVENLVEMHGGSVSAFSEGPGRGSEFVVRLPLVSAEREPSVPDTGEESVAGEESGGLRPPLAKGKRILVVDDNQDSAVSLAMLLRLAGNKTQTAFDGLEAVAAAAKFQPDVILLDIGLPKLNGYEACRKIRQQPWGKSTVLVALTGWGQDEDRQKSREAGFDGHLVKPVDHAALRKLLVEMEARATR